MEQQQTLDVVQQCGQHRIADLTRHPHQDRPSTAEQLMNRWQGTAFAGVLRTTLHAWALTQAEMPEVPIVNDLYVHRPVPSLRQAA